MGINSLKYNKLKKNNYIARCILLIFFFSMFLFPSQVYSHFYGHFTGLIGERMISSQWHIVALNVIMFISFLIPLSYRSRASWKQSGIATAFFISLFVEMYGIPFTILFAAKTINPTHIELIEATSISFAGVDFIFTIPMVYGSIMMLAGALIIAYGWITLYNKGKNGILVTGGIYSFSRHPQYLGFILLILGWMIGWPTFMTLILGSILIAVYIRVCKKEEKELSSEYNYDTYKESTPFMI